MAEHAQGAVSDSQNGLPAEVTVRHELQPGDIGYLTYLHGVLYAQAFGWDHTFDAYVAAPLAAFARSHSTRERIWIVEREGVVAGSVAIVEASSDQAQLRWLLLHPDLRRLGLGRRLVEEAVAFCREQAYASVFLWTVSGLDAAAHLYQSLGFRLTEANTHPLWGAVVTEQRYERALAPLSTTATVDYRVLTKAEVAKLEQLDRAETIEGVYRMREGTLILEQVEIKVPDWSGEDKARRIAALQADYDRGATFFGAFAGPLLVGMGVLNHNPLPSGIDRLQLAGLWVSRQCRRQGVGTALVQLVKREARERGAKALYVSATPSENTVRFYQRLGFQPTAEIDPYLYEKEPEDIHMAMSLES